MKEQIKAKFDEDGVSPVIGVILMVAVTVALVALVTVIVFDIGGDVSESPDATVELTTDASASGGTVTATVLRNENVDGLELDDGTGTTDSTSDPSAGTTLSVNPGADSSGTAQVIATMSDGSEQVLTTTDYDFPPASP
jgi:flagellin-like protein